MLNPDAYHIEPAPVRQLGIFFSWGELYTQSKLKAIFFKGYETIPITQNQFQKKKKSPKTNAFTSR
jgi:hypothetical protein